MKKLYYLVICLILVATVVNANGLSITSQSNEISILAGSNETIPLTLHSDVIPMGINVYTNAPYDLTASLPSNYYYISANDTSISLQISAPWGASPGDSYIELDAYSANESSKSNLLVHILKRDDGPAYVNLTYSPQACIDVYKNESKIFNLEAENVGPKKSFNLVVNEQPADVTTLITPFSYITNMGSGETVNRIATVKVGDNAELGEQSVLVELREKSTDRLYATANLCLNVMEKQSLLASANPNEFTTNPGETVEGTVILKNAGDKSKDLILNTNVKWAELEKTSLRLKPGESQEVNVKMHIPTTLEIGSYGVRVTVTSEITRTVTFQLTVLKKDIETSSTTTQTEINTETGKQRIIDASVTFKNNTDSAYKDAEIKIDDLPSGWSFTSDVSKVTIEPNEEKTIHIYFTPNESVDKPKKIAVSLYESGDKVAEEEITIGKYNMPAVGLFSLGGFSIESVVILLLATAVLYLGWDKYKAEILSKIRKEKPEETNENEEE